MFSDAIVHESVISSVVPGCSLLANQPNIIHHPSIGTQKDSSVTTSQERVSALSNCASTMRVVVSSKFQRGMSETEKDPSIPKVPRGLRGLPSSGRSQTSASSEMHRLQEEAASIERWWSEPRWRHTKRVYSGKYKLCEHMRTRNQPTKVLLVVSFDECPYICIIYYVSDFYHLHSYGCRLPPSLGGGSWRCS
jgi:hypothetical protein